MSLDAERHQVELSDRNILGYDKLVLATGAIPRKLDLPGADALLYLRTHHDSDVLKAAFGDGVKRRDHRRRLDRSRDGRRGQARPART